MTAEYTVLDTFTSFHEAAAFARSEARQRGGSLIVRRGENTGWVVCSTVRRALNDFLRFTSWLGFGQLENPVSELRSLCLNLGLTPAGWRFVHRHGGSAYRAVVLAAQSSELNMCNALCYADWQARGGLKEPLPELLGRNYLLSMGMALDFEHAVDPRMAGIAARHWKTLQNDRLRQQFAEKDWVRVLVWMRDHSPPLDRNQWRSGWDAIQRQFDKWCALHGSEERWESALGEFQLGRWRIVPLQASYDVALEGIRMKHCVATYATRCLLDEYRLFSVRAADDNHRIATVGLEKQTDGWVLEQVKGKCNTSVAKEIEEAAQNICRKYVLAEEGISAADGPLLRVGASEIRAGVGSGYDAAGNEYS